MHVEYGDDMFRRLAEEPDFVPKVWERGVIRAYRKRIQLIVAADDERDLYAMRAVQLQELDADGDRRCSLRLDDQFRVILTVTIDGDRIAVIHEIVDYH